ncbi:hypothetical protein LINPERHAP1_LOCUS2285 [Linum perenne]
MSQRATWQSTWEKGTERDSWYQSLT